MAKNRRGLMTWGMLYEQGEEEKMKKTTCGHEPHYAGGLCKKCHQREYHQRPEVKEHQREYRQRPEVKKKYQSGGKYYYLYKRRGNKKLAMELEKYPWLTEGGKEAMMLDGDCLMAQLKKHRVIEGV